jgi:hypothetical protein
VADPLEEKIQLILDKYLELTSSPGSSTDGETLPLVFGSKARDENATHPRISWVETGGTIENPRGTATGTSAESPSEAAAIWATLDVEIWRATAEACRACFFDLVAAAKQVLGLTEVRWSGYKRDEERHKDDGVIFTLTVSIRLPAPADGTRGTLLVPVLHHTGTLSSDTDVNVAGDAYEQLAWLADNSGATTRLYGFTSSQLAATAEASAARTITLSTGAIGTRTITGCIFDASGNLWCWTAGAEPIFLFRLTPAQLLTTATVTPGIVLTMPSTGDGRAEDAVRARFDHSGNLWLLTAGNYLWRVNAADLGATGTPTPGIEIEFSGQGDAEPVDFLFDHQRSMLVSFDGGDADTPSALFRVTPTEYAASNAALEPAVIIGGDGTGNRRGYGGLALARDGKLWAASRPAGEVERILAYAPDAFKSSANDPPPFYQIFPTWEGDIDSPLGVEFDQEGSLWFTGATANLNRVYRSKLHSGSVTPDITQTASIASPARFAFQTLAL